ncbi:type VI lipase adapter Tla3 domain-containing protein [Paraburkholderia tropica]|uniref:type VI lipase adapter Tla3 domain-containing protein n=1 Tax=Paraburkholderia tropica TaxID=92647 RepID=UPI0009F32745|nr:DUF2875 family protein [Paraburkholderia tropica]
MATTLTRPSGTRLIALVAIIAALWLLIIKVMASQNFFTLDGLSMPQRLLLFFAPVLLVVAGALAATGFARSSNAAEKNAGNGAPTAGAGLSAAAAQSAGNPQFTLEIRRVGVTVDRFRQRALLMRLDEVGPKGAVLLTDPKEYEWSHSTRWDQFTTRTNNIVSYTILDWVQYWPIPTVLVGPPSDVSKSNAVQLGAFLGDADNGSGVGNSFYIRVSDLNTADGSEVVGKLFKLFDEHPDLPAVFVMALDGSSTRGFAKTPGSPLPEFNKDGNFVPTQPDSVVGLVVTRKDRVDQMIRPYATETSGTIDKSKTQYDVVKLSNFYWREQRAYPKPSRGVSDPTNEYWQSKLPDFYKTESLNLPKGFKPNPWVPIPWTTWQLKEFDQWPVLGYLHRPVTVDLSDGHGAPAKKADKIEKLRTGWEQALATLPQGTQPERMFYDTGASTANLALLVQSLHDNKQKIDLDDPADAFDMQHRIGADTGVSSTFVQIALATMIGYGDGKTNALVNLRDPGHATITMLTPPDEASRKANPQVFSWSVPQ